MVKLNNVTVHFVKRPLSVQRYDICSPRTFEKLKDSGLLHLFREFIVSPYCEDNRIYSTRKRKYFIQDLKAYIREGKRFDA